MQIFIHCKATLHVSGVTASIIRSIKNCTRSLRYRSATVCRYLFTAKLLYMFRVSQHPSLGVLKTVPAASDTDLHTVASVGFLFTLNYDARNNEFKKCLVVLTNTRGSPM